MAFNKKQVGRHSTGQSSQNAAHSAHAADSASKTRSSSVPSNLPKPGESLQASQYSRSNSSLAKSQKSVTNTKKTQKTKQPKQPKDPKKKGKGLSTGLLIAGIVLLLVAVAIVVVLVFQYCSARSSYKKVGELAEVEEGSVTVETLSVDWDALREINPEVVGWIVIPGTVINYPIAQAADNSYYLYNLFEGGSSKAGSVFLDSGNSSDFSDKVNLIYGHNLLDGSMFAKVTEYTDEDFFKKHNEILLATPEKNYRLQAVCSVVWPGSDVSIRTFSFESDEAFTNYVQNLLNMASVSSGDQASDIDQLFGLVTCSYQANNVRTIAFFKPVQVVDSSVALKYTNDEDKFGTDYETDKSSVRSARNDGVSYLEDEE